MRNRMYGGVRGRKTKVGEKLLRFPPTRFAVMRWQSERLSTDNLFVAGDLGKKDVPPVDIVHLAAVMLHAVGEDEKVYVKEEIIGRSLLKHMRGDLDRRCLILYDDTRLQVAVVDAGVGPQLLVTTLQGDLVGHKGDRIAQIGGQVVHEVLAYPLLRREGYITATEDIQDAGMVVGAL